MTDGETTVAELREAVATFVHERDWEQFHNAKDLAAAIAIETSELQELFLWKTPEDVKTIFTGKAVPQQVREEIADILILSLSLCNRLHLDVSDIIREKLGRNREKYPVDQYRGIAEKPRDV
jgi:dCTP diphosphatase